MSCCETPYSNYDLVGDGGGSSNLSGLSDVDITSLANDDILQYNSISSKWENTVLTPQVMPQR